MTRSILALGILLMSFFLLTACQPKSQPASTNTPAPAYPAPAQNVSPAQAYPGPSQGVTNFSAWSDVENAVKDGKVAQAYVDTLGHVTLVLKDKSVMLSMGPTTDAFTKLLDQCGAACKDIKVIQP